MTRFRQAAAPERRADFEVYREEQGEALLRFACFECLRQHYAPKPWPQWPAPWRKPDRQSLQEFRVAHRDECEFHEFVQWIADRQLQACQDAARQQGMAIGLYIDLAVGIDPLGADAWSQQDTVLADLSIGAPPDEFNPAGQDWGLAPFNPHMVAANDFEPMRQLMRASMRHAGAIRLDHVLGLKRMFMIPRGLGAAEGAYVRFPFEQLLRVIAEESNRLRCIVIGEDLGTVPEGFRETMARWGLWTYRVMLFEREHDGRFRPPESLSGRGARHVQHSRLADLSRLAAGPRSADQAGDRRRSRRNRRGARTFAQMRCAPFWRSARPLIRGTISPRSRIFSPPRRPISWWFRSTMFWT